MGKIEKNKKKIRNLLENLSKDEICYIVENFNFTQTQQKIIKNKFILFKTSVETCLELNISTSTLSRNLDKIYKKILININDIKFKRTLNRFNIFFYKYDKNMIKT